MNFLPIHLLSKGKTVTSYEVVNLKAMLVIELEELNERVRKGLVSGLRNVQIMISSPRLYSGTCSGKQLVGDGGPVLLENAIGALNKNGVTYDMVDFGTFVDRQVGPEQSADFQAQELKELITYIKAQ